MLELAQPVFGRVPAGVLHRRKQRLDHDQQCHYAVPCRWRLDMAGQSDAGLRAGGRSPKAQNPSPRAAFRCRPVLIRENIAHPSPVPPVSAQLRKGQYGRDAVSPRLQYETATFWPLPARGWVLRLGRVQRPHQRERTSAGQEKAGPKGAGFIAGGVSGRLLHQLRPDLGVNVIDILRAGLTPAASGGKLCWHVDLWCIAHHLVHIVDGAGDPV